MGKFWQRHNEHAYRSGFEDKVATFLLQKSIPFKYEDYAIDYEVPASDHKYTPDFMLTTKDGKNIFIETKGRWESEDRKKHFLVKAQNPEIDIRFLFQNPNAKIRKGSKTTYADVCSGRLRGHKDFIVPYAKAGKNGELPKEWLEEL